MTVGGKTKGMLTKVSRIGFHLDLLFANQYPKGIEIINNINVVTNANLKDKKSGAHSIKQYTQFYEIKKVE